jgi:hypothetical protein
LPEAELNELGQQGWEHYLVMGNTYFFKREIIAPRIVDEPQPEQKKQQVNTKKGK